jgi:uncharacterized protein (DUF362 family)
MKLKYLEFIKEEYFNKVFKTNLSRKGFLKFLTAFFAFIFASNSKTRKVFAAASERLDPRPKRKIITDCDLAAAIGDDPSVITRKAIDALGGIKKFLKSGDVVVVKPNIGWDRAPEQAADTNPEVVKTIVKMCLEGGAKIVKVFDNPCNDPRRCYKNSGIFDAVKEAGGVIFYMDDWKYFPGNFPGGSVMADWPMFRDAVKCDCFINVPVAKHHSLTYLTLSMKNLMGVCGGSRGEIHQNIEEKLPQVTQFINPELTIIDAYRVLLRHGPSGGDLQDVKKLNTVIAGTDPVLTDSYAAKLMNKQPEDIGYIKAAAREGLGSMDLAKAKIRVLKT